ncbi:hypothetical protein HY024_04545 [Candidatus Curtissbacteria bacterium]|nr:hypothetical protein [Candidatus Curtissbacteria bacterium]
MEELKLQNPTTLLRKVPTQKFGKLKGIAPIIIIAAIVLAGITTGVVVSSRNKNTKIASQKASISENQLSGEQKQSFNQTFRDSAQGTIQKNDKLDKYAQGTHRLVRPGGEDQTAYLTSSVLDLDQYVGKKVKVFGETFGSSQVGWLMDVGKVEVQN